jgi:type IV pilus assembly protein PilF
VLKFFKIRLGEFMARTIGFRCIFLLIILLLNGCHARHQTTTPTVSPSRIAARENAHLVFSYLHQGYTDKAYEKLQLALTQAPDDPVILDTAGYYYEKTGRLRAANRYYKEATVASPYSGIAKNNYGAFLCRNGYYKASIPLFLQAAATPHTPITQQARQNAQYCSLKLKSRLGDSVT